MNPSLTRRSMRPSTWAALYALCAAIGLVVLSFVAPRPAAPEAAAVCREQVAEPSAPLPCLQGLRPSILTAELAGTPVRWACQLQRREPLAQLTLAQAQCAEMRGARLRDEVQRFDNQFFIPLYALMSLLVVGWTLAIGNVATGGQGRRIGLAALVLAASTAALVALDRRENRQVLVVLDVMASHGALVAAEPMAAPPETQDARLTRAAEEARQASLHKWAVTAAWAACLAWAYAIVLRARGAAGHARWRRVLWTVPVLALAAAALGFGAGTALGLAGDGLRGPTLAISLGMRCALGGMVFAAAVVPVFAWAGRGLAPPPRPAGTAP